MNILHLSDLHFGLEKSETEREKHKNNLEALIPWIVAAIKEQKTDYIVVSGDIGWKGIRSDYEQAGEFFSRILAQSCFSSQNIIVCPGNHDLIRDSAKQLKTPLDFEESGDLLNAEGLKCRAAPFVEFSRFCEEMKFSKPVLRSEYDSHYLVGTVLFEDVQFAVLNTAWTAVNDESDGELWIGNSFWESIVASGRIDMSKPLITVMHHPESSVNTLDKSFYSGTTNTLDKIQKCSYLILSGHTHEIKIEPKPIKSGGYSVGCGTTYGGQNYTNLFTAITLESSQITLIPFTCLSGEWTKLESKSYSTKLENPSKISIIETSHFIGEKLVELGFSIENCTFNEFEQPGKLIWPVVPRKNITHIHQAQIELMSLMVNKYKWEVEILISDCGSKTERLTPRGIATFKENIESCLTKRGITSRKLHLLSSFFKNTHEANNKILENFISISSAITKAELEGLKNKAYNHSVITDNQKSPVLDYILPLLQMAVVCYLGQTASLGQNTYNKSLIVAGNDELLQWRYVLREREESKLGAVLIPSLRDSDQCDSWQQGIRKYLSHAELMEDIKTGNLAYWLYVLFIKLQQYNTTCQVSRYDLSNEILCEWHNKPFEINSSINYEYLAKEVWKTLS